TPPTNSGFIPPSPLPPQGQIRPPSVTPAPLPDPLRVPSQQLPAQPTNPPQLTPQPAQTQSPLLPAPALTPAPAPLISPAINPTASGAAVPTTSFGSEYIADDSCEISGDVCEPMFIGGGGGYQNLFGNQSFLRINTPLTFHMLDFQNRQTDKELRILQDGPRPGEGPSITFGGQFRATALYGETNTENRFPYLGRFPPDFVGTRATDIRMLQSNQAFVFHGNSWAHGYFETLFSDVFTFNSFEQGSFQVRQAYVVLGDLNANPFYLFAGKKNVPFGDFRTLSPFSQAMPWHYFAGLAEGGGVGFSSNGLSAQAMALAGGRGIRVVDSEGIGQIENFAANVRYDAELSDNVAVGIGAGYLRGTIYDANVAEHTDPTVFGPFNGAWDINGSLHVGALRLGAEFVQTEEAWPVTGARVTAWQAEAAYDFFLGGTPCTFSGSYSEGRQGPAGSEFEFNRQLIVGLKAQPSRNAFLTVEYVRSTGFAPLIGITRASDRGVEQNSMVAGIVLAI
ncbi:MAG: LbtU family siderophore porin, partial [Planctomycetaceae bacterium]